MAPSQNKDRPSTRPDSIHISKPLQRGGKQVVITSHSCIGNWLLRAIPSPIATSTGNSFVTFQRAGRRVPLTASFHALLCSHEKRCFCFFVAPKILWPRAKKRWRYCDLYTRKWIRHMRWSSSSPRCCVNVQESTLMGG